MSAAAEAMSAPGPDDSTTGVADESTQAELAARGARLVRLVAVGLGALLTLLVYLAAWNDIYRGHFVLVMLKLAWLLFVCQRLSQGRAWARWFLVVTLALSTMLGVAWIASPPEGSPAATRPLLAVLVCVQASILYVLAFSDAAAAFFRRVTKPT